MQKLRRFNFFDRSVVKAEKADLHPGIQKLNVTCARGGAQSLWLGDKSAQLHRLDRQFALSPPLQAFEHELVDLRVLDERRLLVALGSDAPPGRDGGSGGARYKVFDLKKEGDPTLLVNNRVFPQRTPEQRVTCFEVNSTFSLLAVGLETGVVHLFRGRDLSSERPQPTLLTAEGDQQQKAPITGVHFLEQQKRTVLFVCTAVSVRSWSVLGDDNEVRQLNIDTSGGSPELCSCVFPTTSALLVGRGEAIFAYDPEEGNMSAIPLEDDKLILTQFKSYFVAVTAEGGGGAARGAVASSPSVMPKQNVNICLAYPHMRFIAYSGQFTDVTHVFAGLGGIFVLSRGGADSNTVLFELREKELPKQLEILVSKGMFEWAAEIALRSGAPAENVADIYRQHGDRLFEKRAYDQALAVYTKTVDLGLPLEPSYIVERYLDAHRIGHVAKYLKRLHERNMAEREHTALLLKCYTKLKDFSTLEEFLETTPVSQYDPATAIGVLEAAGYYGLAAAISEKVGMHEDFVRISLEHFKSYNKTVEFLRNLPRSEASKILLDHGRPLMRHAPKETIELTRELCGLRGGLTAPPEDAPNVDEFLPIFVEDLPQLEGFLRSILLPAKDVQVPPEAERLFPTFLELLVRSHQRLLQEDPLDDEKVRVSHEEIMRLIRQYPGKQALHSTLMLCQTYNFVDGFFHAAEGLGRYQMLMNWCFEQRDAKRLLQVCDRAERVGDPSLWVQALSFLAVDESDPLEEIGEVLKHIVDPNGKNDLMPLLMVIETLQQNPRISVDAVRLYLKDQFKRLSESVDSSRRKAREDRQEIERMQQEIVGLRTRGQVFQNAVVPKCFQCGLTLEVPAVHFFCAHSYHSYCMPADGNCPKCSSEALAQKGKKEQREAQARNTEAFFKELQGGGGEGGVQVMGEWCKKGAFDASL